MNVVILILMLSGCWLALLPAFISPRYAAAVESCGDSITISTTLTTDIGPCNFSNGINMGADNITLDCNSHKIIVTAGFSGVMLDGRSGDTVRNCDISGGGEGVVIQFGSNNNLERNTAAGDGGYIGITVLLSDSNKLEGNTAKNFQVGFLLQSNSKNIIHNNNAIGNYQQGFWIFASDQNEFIGNNALDNAAWGFDVSFSSNNEFKGNLAKNNGFGYGCCYPGFGISGNDNFGSNNLFQGNSAISNAADGFTVLTIKNFLDKNRADNNSKYGYMDGTTGNGTAGTANTYLMNECHGNLVGDSSPHGLCSTQTLPKQPVGGEILGIDLTSLFVAGAIANQSWIIPIAGVTAAGLVGFALRKKIR